MQATSVRLYRRLAPGLTIVTRHAIGHTAGTTTSEYIHRLDAVLTAAADAVSCAILE
jgi:hypothetical protein